MCTSRSTIWVHGYVNGIRWYFFYFFHMYDLISIMNSLRKVENVFASRYNRSSMSSEHYVPMQLMGKARASFIIYFILFT